MHSPVRGRVVPLAAMFAKILLTVVIALIAWHVIRTRRRTRGQVVPPPMKDVPLIPAGFLRALAYGLVLVMVAGSGLYLVQGWVAGREVLTVRVINANTGEGVTYRARREDVTGRSFRTLDGRRVTLADVERMELDEQVSARSD